MKRAHRFFFAGGPVIFTVPARSTLKLHFNPLAEVITLLNDDVLYTDAVCNLPPEIGPCDAYFPRYYYNSTTRSCEPFIYGGCSGNDNRFTTVAECEARCLRQRLGESSTEYPLISPAIIHNAMVATTIRLRFDGRSTAV